MTGDSVTRRREVARVVLDAVNAAQTAADAIWAALDTGQRLGVAVPGFHDLIRTRQACAHLADDHSTARVLARAELTQPERTTP